MSEPSVDPPTRFIAPGEAPPIVAAPVEETVEVSTVNAPPSQVDEKKSLMVLLLLVGGIAAFLYFIHWSPVPTATQPSTQTQPSSATKSFR